MPLAQSKRTDRLFGILIFSCMLLIIWEIFIFEKTFIPLPIPLSLLILTGIAITLISRGKFVYTPTPSPFKQLLFNIIVWGGLTMFGFMWMNYHLCARTTHVITQKIISTGHLAARNGSCQQPYIVVNYNGQDKQLEFDCDTPVESFKSVDLTIAKGLFGFDVVLASTLRPN